MNKLQTALAWAYALIAVVTFGHSWPTAGIFALYTAAAWPLYWSVQLWK